MTSPIIRILLIVLVAIGAHLLVLAIRTGSRKLLQVPAASPAKMQTLTGFASSIVIFVLYFLAVGFVLKELGVSLTAYLASATVIGLAVSFGSQGLVQDMITGLTVVFADLLDVGDMVEVGGQVGIVQKVGIRFTVLINFTGAQVFIPNRTIANVVNYPRGYVRAFLDARLPEAPELEERAEALFTNLVTALYEQFPGIMLTPPTVEGRNATSTGVSYLRVKFRIWPGQGSILETVGKQTVVQGLRQLDTNYADWMVAVYYRAEPRGGDPKRQLPRPAALQQRSRQC